MREQPKNGVLNVRLTFPKNDLAGNLSSGIFEISGKMVIILFT